MRTIDTVVQEVLGYLKLKPGWDGMHSQGPRKAMVKLVGEFLTNLPIELPVPVPMISCGGVIGLYWDEAKSYIDIEFQSEENISMLVVNKKESGRDRWADKLTPLHFTTAFFNEYFSQLKEQEHEPTLIEAGVPGSHASLSPAGFPGT